METRNTVGFMTEKHLNLVEDFKDVDKRDTYSTPSGLKPYRWTEGQKLRQLFS